METIATFLALLAGFAVVIALAVVSETPIRWRVDPRERHFDDRRS